MATQGILSIVVGGKVVAKAIVGADGYEMPAIAEDVKANNVTTAKGLLDLCHKRGLGGESLIVQSSPREWIGDCTDDELPDLYAEKFHDPRFNPRWKYGTADYIEVVDMTHNAALTGGEAVRVEGTVMQQTEE